jgi:hypothetical protein
MDTMVVVQAIQIQVAKAQAQHTQAVQVAAQDLEVLVDIQTGCVLLVVKELLMQSVVVT